MDTSNDSSHQDFTGRPLVDASSYVLPTKHYSYAAVSRSERNLPDGMWTAIVGLPFLSPPFSDTASSRSETVDPSVKADPDGVAPVMRSSGTA